MFNEAQVLVEDIDNDQMEAANGEPSDSLVGEQPTERGQSIADDPSLEKSGQSASSQFSESSADEGSDSPLEFSESSANEDFGNHLGELFNEARVLAECVDNDQMKAATGEPSDSPMGEQPAEPDQSMADDRSLEKSGQSASSQFSESSANKDFDRRLEFSESSATEDFDSYLEIGETTEDGVAIADHRLLMPQNPYSCGSVIDSKQKSYIERNDLVARIEQSLRDQSVLLCGPRRIGKTSLLVQLKESLTGSDSYVAVSSDLMKCKSYSLGEALFYIAVQISKKLGLSNPASDISEPTGECFRKDFLPSVLGYLKDGERLVLLLDELDVVDTKVRIHAAKEDEEDAEPARTSFLRFLQKLITSEPQVRVVAVVGHRLDDMSIEFMQLLKSCLMFAVPLLDPAQTERLIRKAEYAQTLLVSREAADAVQMLTGGQPYLTQLICSELWYQGHYAGARPWAKKQIIRADVDNAAPRARRTADSSFNDLWKTLRPDERIVLRLLVNLAPPGEDIVEDVLCKRLSETQVRISAGNVAKALDHLQWLNILNGNNGVYRIAIGLLRSWLVQFKPLRSIIADLADSARLAQGLITQAISSIQRGETLSLQMATRLLEAAKDLCPSDPAIMEELAHLYLLQNRRTALISMFDPPVNVSAACLGLLEQALIEQAHELKQNGQLEQAQSLYEKTLALSPGHEESARQVNEILALRFQAAMVGENFEDALKLSQHPRLADQPGLRRTRLFQISQAYEKAGDLDKALSILHDLSRQEPLQTEQRHFMRWVEDQQALPGLLGASEEALRQANWEVAIAGYSKILGAQPDRSSARAALSKALAGQALASRYSDGVKCYQDGQWETAVQHLAAVVAVTLEHKDALPMLVRAVDERQTATGGGVRASWRSLLDELRESKRSLRNRTVLATLAVALGLFCIFFGERKIFAKFEESINLLNKNNLTLHNQNLALNKKTLLMYQYLLASNWDSALTAVSDLVSYPDLPSDFKTHLANVKLQLELTLSQEKRAEQLKEIIDRKDCGELYWKPLYDKATDENAVNNKLSAEKQDRISYRFWYLNQLRINQCGFGKDEFAKVLPVQNTANLPPANTDPRASLPAPRQSERPPTGGESGPPIQEKNEIFHPMMMEGPFGNSPNVSVSGRGR